MSRPAPAAGGFFLILAILAGFVIGVVVGDPLGWSLIGTVLGIAIATIVWILDRRRAGR